MTRGEKLTAGAEAELFGWTDDPADDEVRDGSRVLKLFYRGLEYEAGKEHRLLPAFLAAGLPVPRVYGDLVEVDGRVGIVMERIDGPDMDQLIERKALDFDYIHGIGTRLGRLHWELHRASVETGRTQKEEMSDRLTRASGLTSSEKQRAQQLLNSLPDGTAVCHNDFHTRNVLENVNESLVIIDCGAAVTGDPLSDVARTQLQFTTSWIGANVLSVVLFPLVSRIRAALNAGYTAAYLAESGASAYDIERWQPVVAACGLADGMPLLQRWVVLGQARRGLAS
ncbi:MAG: aminoglycoside phosphotransferase family protein [Proteobacteria bacterium]|nr:aminoglycoside phosphotransferase family protein [Pseudomonadota bacterium]MDA1301628.1 aminoglycoside phosphotransferase family protein [Pseudomonadota bacterium]